MPNKIDSKAPEAENRAAIVELLSMPVITLARKKLSIASKARLNEIFSFDMSRYFLSL